MIITIDGPAGSGKSTAARKLAAALEIPYLDTGAMYRAVALKALNTGTDFDDPEALARLARQTRIELDCGPTYARVEMDGHDVSEAIRSMRVSEHTSKVARVPGVRQVLIEQQRAIARRLGALVTEGRDQGSVVFPQADVKFVLTATAEKRAERRYHELLVEGETVDLENVLENIKRRDANDRVQWAPLLNSGEAIEIDTSHRSIAEVVALMLRKIQLCKDHASEDRSPGS
ncbi:MAG: cytidylate kinase [Phycisphaerae bacterium]